MFHSDFDGLTVDIAFIKCMFKEGHKLRPPIRTAEMTNMCGLYACYEFETCHLTSALSHKQTLLLKWDVFVLTEVAHFCVLFWNNCA